MPTRVELLEIEEDHSCTFNRIPFLENCRILSLLQIPNTNFTLMSGGFKEDGHGDRERE